MQYFKNKQYLKLAALLLMVVFASFAVVYYASNKSQNKVTSASAACPGTCVGLYADKASPNTFAVAVGSFVQFNSKDGKTHDLSLGAGGETHEHKGKFQSGDFGADEGWKVQFNDEGTFTFHDHFNPLINVVVIVYTPGKDYKVQ